MSATLRHRDTWQVARGVGLIDLSICRCIGLATQVSGPVQLPPCDRNITAHAPREQIFDGKRRVLEAFLLQRSKRVKRRAANKERLFSPGCDVIATRQHVAY